jgi:aryl-alcohol dehydrogenase-like predicted oxidoreductase
MSSIKKIKLGNQGLVVPSVGLGTMGMTKNGDYEVYGKADETESTATIHRSFELGGNLLYTANLYGTFANEKLIPKATKGKRD